jgi:hypothetical protein
MKIVAIHPPHELRVDEAEPEAMGAGQVTVEAVAAAPNADRSLQGEEAEGIIGSVGTSANRALSLGRAIFIVRAVTRK